jgi:PAS domain S-box-containing protein
MEAKAKILIVEDERIPAEEIKSNLEYLGYTITSIVSSGEDAVREAEESRPDLILMDIKLKGEMDGIEAAKRIRASADIPIIYITALSDRQTIERTKVTEPLGFVHKPVEEKELNTSIEMALLRHKMERRLKESEERFRDLVEKAGIAILIDDKKGNFKYFNKRLLELFGCEAQELEGQPIQSIIHPEDVQRVLEFHKGRIQGKKVPSRYEFRGVKKDGSTIYIEVDVVTLKERDRIVGTRSYLWDITERKQAETALRESEEKFRNIFENATDGMVYLDTRGRIVDVNESAVRMFGGTRKELLGKHFSKIGVFPKKILPLILKCFKIALKRKRYTLNDLVIKNKKGEEIYLESTASSLKKNNEIVGLLVISRDVTERKKAEEELIRLSTAMRISSDSIVLSDLKGNIIDVNEATLKMYETEDREDLIGKSAFDLIAPEERRRARGGLKQVLKKGYNRNQEYHVVTKKGTKLPVEMSSALMKDSHGKPIGFVGMSRDITERRRAESQLRNQAEILRNVQDSVIVTDVEGKISHWNEGAVQIFGYSSEEMLGESITKVCKPEERERIAASQLEMLRKGTPFSGEWEGIRKDGEPVWLILSTVPMKGPKGEISGLLGVGKDITDRKKAEKEKERFQEQLIHSEKMAGIGTLTSGIAHEFNNLLQIIKGYTEFANRTQKPQDIQEAFDVVISNTERARRIVRDLQSFARQEVSKRERVDAADLIDSVLSLTSEYLEKHNIKVVKKYKNSPLIKVNRGEMEQVFLHMVTNARDAMLPEGGKLKIKVVQSTQNVEISFSDTGEGIEKESLSKIFEPFYTTKGPVGKSEIPGIGLGLSVSYGIVKRHGGTIDVESQVGRGTTFTISLPFEEEKQERERKKIKEKKNTTDPQPLNILVVDDEEEICRMMSKWLSLEGHEVNYTMTGKKAISLAKKKHFDLIFLDMVMPGIPALDVLDKLNEVSPASYVFIMTGKLMDNNLSNQLKQKGASGYLQKPFELDEVLKIIKK